MDPSGLSKGDSVQILDASDNHVLDQGEVRDIEEDTSPSPYSAIIRVESRKTVKGHLFSFGYFPDLKACRILSGSPQEASPHGKSYLLVPLSA